MARTRSIANALHRILSASTVPLYCLDDNRTIVYANQALAAWVGLEVETLVGRRCDYHSQTAATLEEAIPPRLCPPPDAFAGEQLTADIILPKQNSQQSRRSARFVPLSGEREEMVGVLVVLSAIDDVETQPDQPGGDFSAAGLHQVLMAFRAEIEAYYQLDQLIGISPEMQRVRRRVAVAIDSQASVLIYGQPGSGREHLARTIHYGNDAKHAPPILPLACSLFDAELLQATITAFISRQPDREQLVPSILLSDVDRLPLDAQAELIGLIHLPRLSLRTIATSTRPLTELSDAGEFSAELAHLLSTLTIQLPSLSQRPDDIPLLAQYYLEQFNAQGYRQLTGFSDEALDQLSLYPWPGNIDELADFVARACDQADPPLVKANHLPDEIRWEADATAHPRPTEETIVLDDYLAEIEKELIIRALTACQGNKAKAARWLGVSRARLHRRVSQLGLS